MSHNSTYFIVQLWNENGSWIYNDGSVMVTEFSSKLEAEKRVKRLLSKDSRIFAAKIFRVIKNEVAHIDNDVWVVRR